MDETGARTTASALRAGDIALRSGVDRTVAHGWRVEAEA